MKLDFDINNDILLWAIKRSGYELPEFFNVFPRVVDWLEKRNQPTIKQLQTFANKVHLPFGYLFLDNPPEEKLPIPFFRTGKSGINDFSLNVYDTTLLLQKRQEWLSDYLRDNEHSQLDFVGKYNNVFNVQEVVESIRTTLNLSKLWAKEQINWEKAREYLAQVIEEIGIILVFNSVVENNNHRKIKVEECRGFVLVNLYAPFMFINSSDSKAAQMFTMIHELAHIWIGYSAGFDLRQLQPASNAIEIFCDQVAAEFLVPSDSFLHIWNQENNFKFLARYFKVSQIVIARRALDLEKINRHQFFEFYENYMKHEHKGSEEKETGGDYYKTQRKRLSVKFVSYINEAVTDNKLLVRDAYNLTGMKGDTFHKFMKEHLY